MAAIYTRRLVAVRLTAAFDGLVYTVPTGAHVVLRDIAVTNSSATAVAQVTLMMRPAAGGLDVVIFLLKDMAFGTQHRDVRVALNVGDSLRFVAPAVDLSLALTGYVFE